MRLVISNSIIMYLPSGSKIFFVIEYSKVLLINIAVPLLFVDEPAIIYSTFHSFKRVFRSFYVK